MNLLKETLHIDQNETFLHYFSRPGVRRKVLTGVLLLTVVYSLALYGGIEIREATATNYDLISSLLSQYSSISWLIYVGLLVLAVMSPLPDSIVILAGGFIFGPVIGTILTIIGQSMGASFDFLLARKLGREFVIRKFPRSSSIVDTYSHTLGWQTVFLMRLLPTLSFDIFSYASGLSSLSFKKYYLATTAGLIPLAIITTVLGHSANIHSASLATATLFIGALAIVGISYATQHIVKTKK